MSHDADAAEDSATEDAFAPFIRILGRGPGRSRSLTREEARTALAQILRGTAAPEQVGAFLMLLRYRGEDPDEVAGLVEAAREAAGCGGGTGMAADLDWPSYGAGRTRGAPWFLLAALALSRSGHRVLMHGSNAFSSDMPVAEALRLLDLRAASGRDDAARLLDEAGFAYLPLSVLSPELDRLLNLRALLGLRSPINTVARLLNPFDAPCGVDGVFHPPYIAVHLGAAERLHRCRLLVVKGSGGEAERTPAKVVTAHLLAVGTRSEHAWPALRPGPARAAAPEDLRSVWYGTAAGFGLDTVLATVAMGILALGIEATAEAADRRASEVWALRHGRTLVQAQAP